jgi:hypothetical protein
VQPSRNDAGRNVESTDASQAISALNELARLLDSPASDVPWGSVDPGSGTRQPLSLHEFARSLGSGDATNVASLRARIEETKLCVNAPDAPILAVMGLLNAGKSSMVGACLSEHGRQRVLIGSGNREGTHRFILWLPSQWRANPAVWNYVQTRLLSVFPAGFEFLAEDPDRAAEQYNDLSFRSSSHFDAHQSTSGSASPPKVSAMEIPLVAFDDALDRLQMALMDCPDVQTGLVANPPATPNISGPSSTHSESYVHQAESIARKRMEILTQAAPICSAFMIVLPANALHDQKVSELMQTLRSRMPHTLQIAAVNRVPRRYRTEEIRDEIARLYGDRCLERIYMAYGYDGPQQRERIPAPPSFFTPSNSGTDFPLFFRIDTPSCPQPPVAIRDSDWFFSIGQELPVASLLQDAIRSHVASLHRQWRDTSETVHRLVQESQQRREAMRRVLAEACLDFSQDPASGGRIRLQASHKIVEQISHSLERTAPWWARPGRWTSKLAEAGKSRVQQLGEWLRLPAWIGGKTEGLLRYIRSRWSSNEGAQVVSAESLFRSIQRMDLDNVWQTDAPMSKSQDPAQYRNLFVQKLQRGMDRFQSESTIELDDKELDALTSQMWNQMPWGKRLATGLAPAAILFAPLLAVIMLPLDFGGSSVLVFASVKELLGAGVAGLGFALLSPDQMPKIAESEAAWRQMGDLVAALCDTLDLERPSDAHPISLRTGDAWRVLPVSTMSADKIESVASGQRIVPPSLRIHRSTLDRFDSICRALLDQ